MPQVTEIIEEAVRSGEGKKGHWEMHKVRLDDGTETNIFAPIEIGDEVESYQNGDYVNWRKVGEGGGNGGSVKAKSNDEIWAQNVDIIKKLERLQNGQDSLVRQLKLKDPSVEQRELVDEPINLDDIPF